MSRHRHSPPPYQPSYGDLDVCAGGPGNCGSVYGAVIRKDPRKSHWRRLGFFGRLLWVWRH